MEFGVLYIPRHTNRPHWPPEKRCMAATGSLHMHGHSWLGVVRMPGCVCCGLVSAGLGCITVSACR